MDTGIYELVRGPLVWIGFAGLLGGSLYRLLTLGRQLMKERAVMPTMSAKFGARSVAHWLVPFATRNTRLRPGFTVLSFAFHICLLVTPLFAMGHAVLWQESWGLRWWSLPQGLVDVMTLVVILVGLAFMVRRYANLVTRKVSSWSDYLLMLLVIGPFLTGYAAHAQWVGGDVMTTLHIVSGVLWLVAIPFTRLSHMLWFVFSRAFMGSEFGEVRHARDW